MWIAKNEQVYQEGISVLWPLLRMLEISLATLGFSATLSIFIASSQIQECLHGGGGRKLVLNL